MGTIGERLKAERKRLGHSQEEFATVAGVTRRPYAEWESGNTSPTAVQLASIAAIGADVRYIVTGDRDGPPPLTLSPDEQVMLDRYRSSPRPLKDAALRVLLGGETSPENGTKSQPKISIGGKFEGQVIEGNQTNHAPLFFGGKPKIKK